jgi:Na+/H+ antiporter NhaD/arsenite permease-like protein
MGYVALAFAFAMLVRFKSTAHEKYAALDWDLLFFFSTLFIVVEVMAFAGVLDVIGGGIEQLVALGGTGGPMALLAAAALASSVTDNIPLAAVLAEILHDLPTIDDQPNLWWSVILGANLGGNITPIGSASTVVGMTIMHKAKLDISFVGFMKKAAPFAVVHIALACIYVLAL